MATYKVIQDVEAEDKLIGPLTLRQFIYAAIAAVSLYLSFMSITKHALFLLVFFLPIALLSGFFAFPWGRDQPTEIWALAKIRFAIKPHLRIWDQSGVKELVTITVPKRSPTVYTDGLSRSEVESRLKALASMIDTRGWATKNVNVNLSASPVTATSMAVSDRLIDNSTLPKVVPEIDVQAADDVLDEKNNPTAYNLDQMISSSTKQHRQDIVDRVQQKTQSPETKPEPKPDYWFLNQTTPSGPATADNTTFDSSVVAPGSVADDNRTPDPSTAAEEKAISDELKARHEDDSMNTYREHMKTIEPLSSKKATKKPPKNDGKVATSTQVTPVPDPAILALASNNDLNVATIARQANRTNNPKPLDDEVVITLH